MKDRYAKMEEALVGTGESRSERQARELAELKRMRQWQPPTLKTMKLTTRSIEAKASNQKLSKLTVYDVKRLRRLYAFREGVKKKLSNGNLCKRFNICPVTLNRIVNKRHYKNV